MAGAIWSVTLRRYDVIMIDPPPPVQAAGSSLLYSQDFYAVVKERLQPGGILCPMAATRRQSRASLGGPGGERIPFPMSGFFLQSNTMGWHFFASDRPIQDRSAAELVARMPARAVTDMMEWGPAKTPDEQFDLMLSAEMTAEQMIAPAPATPALQDDRPINEYFVLRTPQNTIGSMIRRFL